MDSPRVNGVNGRRCDAALPNATANGVSHGKNCELHRIAEVRARQGVSLRTAARSWNVELAEVRAQQNAQTDLSLSQLYQWQELLNVPVDELLVDHELPLSPPVLKRARLLKIMKTAATIREQSREKSTQRLIAQLIEQLIEIMPELAEVGPWQAGGSRRSLDDFGRAVERTFPDELVTG